LNNFLNLEIVSPEKKVFKGNVQAVTVPGELGEFQVLYNHAPIVAVLDIGRVKIKKENGEENIYAISGGVIEVNNNNVSVLAETIELNSDIDKSRAENALEKAEAKIMTKEDIERKEAVYQAIRRAKNRIKLAG
jgi:F-type H+-transporting ATPase subunit epsilon